MEKAQFLLISIVAIALALSMGGCVTAEITALGTVSEFDSLSWTISSSTIDGILEPGEVQATTHYGESTIANDGLTSYSKFTGFNTGNMIAGQYNLNTLRMFSFDGIHYGSGTGHAVSEESVGIETEGAPGNTTDESGFYESVSAGSSLDIGIGSVTSESQARTVAADDSVPLALNYHIGVTGLNSGLFPVSPAIGSVSSYYSGRVITGRDNTTYPSSDLAFSGYSSATGLISQFDRSVHYQSGPGNWFY
jgi:hypothetical protein